MDARRAAPSMHAYNIVFSVLDFCASEIRSRTALDATALGDLPSFLAMTMSGSCCLASSRSRRTSSRLHCFCMIRGCRIDRVPVGAYPRKGFVFYIR
jgi:hypothetical protein